jgi:hypothetical protein
MARSGTLLRTLILSFAFGCVSAAPAGETKPPTTTSPPMAPDTTSPPAAPAALECQLLLRAHVEPRGPRAARLYVTAENVGSAPLRVDLPDRCPMGPIDFEGLGAGYDYYSTCNAGACAGPRTPTTHALAPGQPKEVASTTIYLDGAVPCAEPLSPGHHRITPVAPALDVPVCVVGTSLDVRPPPPPPAPPRQEPPARKRDPSDPYSCEAPSDCVLSCPSAPGCCGWACGCRHAIHRDHREAFEASYPETCTKHPHCPAVACMHDPAIGATCRAGRCVGVSRPSELSF